MKKRPYFFYKITPPEEARMFASEIGPLQSNMRRLVLVIPFLTSLLFDVSFD